MGSQTRLNLLLRRCVVGLRPAVASGRQWSEKAPSSNFSSKCDIRRSYSTTSGEAEPVRSSYSFSDVRGKYLKFNIPGVEKTETDDALCVFLNMPAGVEKEDVMVRVERKRDADFLAVEVQEDRVRYMGGMKLPENVDRSCIKGEMIKDGLFKLTLPKLKDYTQSNEANVFANLLFNFRLKLALRLYASLPSVLMPIVRSYLVKRFCPEPFMSFSFCKEETPNSLNIILTPGLDNTECTGEGAISVTLNMPGVKTHNAKSYLKHEALFIEGKAKFPKEKVHYVTAIRLPESFLKKRSMTHTEMQDGIYRATLSHFTGEIKLN